jgi:hypothetical protein
MILMTVPDKIATVAAGIVRDPAAWMGSVVSTISTLISGGFASISFPTSHEGWGALTVSLLTSIYLFTRIVTLWAGLAKGKKTTDEE